MATTSLEPTTGSGVSIREFTEEEQYYVASQWQLMWRKFRRHRLGYASGVLLLIGYFFAITYDFWIPYDFTDRHEKLSAPPSRIHVIDSTGTWQMPFVYGTQSIVDPQSFKRTFEEDPEQVSPIGLSHKARPTSFGACLSGTGISLASRGRPFTSSAPMSWVAMSSREPFPQPASASQSGWWV